MSKNLTLKNIRKQNNLTQEGLSKLLGVSRTTITMYELKKSKPSIKTLEKMSLILKTDIDVLLKCFTNKKTTINSPGRLKVDSGLNN